MGALLLGALLALALGVFSTSAVIMLLKPVFVAGVLFAIVAFSQLYRSAPAREVAYIGAAFSAGSIWLPLSLSFESAGSFDPSPAVTVGLGLVTSTLAPLFALSQDGTRVHRWLLITTAVTVVLATGTAMFLPPFSASAPQPVNLIHLGDRDRGLRPGRSLRCRPCRCCSQGQGTISGYHRTTHPAGRQILTGWQHFCLDYEDHLPFGAHLENNPKFLLIEQHRPTGPVPIKFENRPFGLFQDPLNGPGQGRPDVVY